MYLDAPLRLRAALIPLAVLGLAGASFAQAGASPSVSPAPVRADWRQVGTAALAMDLPSPAGGPVARVWYDSEGTQLFVRTSSGAVYSTTDFERWTAARTETPAARQDSSLLDTSVFHSPEANATVRVTSALPTRVYAAGSQVYRSDNGGRNWDNLTQLDGQSILGGTILDLAVSPRDPDEAVAVNRYGVWVSHDGGVSWSGANEGLPNLPAVRILGSPGNRQGVRILVDDSESSSDSPQVFAWQPGQKVAWLPALPRNLGNDLAPQVEEALRTSLSAELQASVSAVAMSGTFFYAGTDDGRVFSSSDSGDTWHINPAAEGSGKVTAIFVDPADVRVALATFAAGSTSNRSPRVVRTWNGGIVWDDISANLPAGAAHGATADHESGAIYVATDSGVYFTTANLVSPEPVSEWRKVGGALPSEAALDAKLDASGNQLYVVLKDYGVYAAMAPHRALKPALVHAADRQSGAAAPGDLFSLLGARVQSANAGTLRVPVLDSDEKESQIQIPFEASGDSLNLELSDGANQFSFGVRLRSVSPAIFVDRDGSPFLIDADTGLQVGLTNPARSGSRIQVLATGLGRVEPGWPSGTPAPQENPPKVAAEVRILIDGAEVPVSRATLAPGYVGFYLVEFELPNIVNSGPAQLVLQAGGISSNAVTLQLEP